MVRDEALKKMNANFTYKGERFEEWRIMDPDKPMQGDCEDYALTLAWLLAGRSRWRLLRYLATGRIRLHFVKTRAKNDGHCILELEGVGRSYFTDNNFQRWVSRADMVHAYRFCYRYPLLLIGGKFLLSLFTRFLNRRG